MRPPTATRFPTRRKIRLPLPVYCEGHAFLVTIGAAKRFPWFRVHPTAADLVVTVLSETARSRASALYAWCVMPDHVHLLLEDGDIVEFIRLFKGRAASAVRRLACDRTLWQRSFYDHGLRREESVDRVAQYIFENPVRADLVASPQDYLWSGSNVWPEWRQGYGRG